MVFKIVCLHKDKERIGDFFVEATDEQVVNTWLKQWEPKNKVERGDFGDITGINGFEPFWKNCTGPHEFFVYNCFVAKID